ncbi:uncharacterized protein LOC131254333 [Magnolia sinica]|uniref:uncharacterized protein LOC131254333 n=1 Tax=Magnolia sinica TaxID=86752 RepID=UPI00265AEA86|nr:uncharacterized protein LOC131254333 [Magnolia sinica]
MTESCRHNNWFSILVNGESCGFFKSTRGLRQGDSLSPCLFILAAEALSRGFSTLIADGLCSPFKLKQGCLQLSHLLYADDTVLFINGSRRSLSAVRDFLHKISQRQASALTCGKVHFSVLLSSLQAEGGLGIRKLKDVVRALHLKMAWRVRHGQWEIGRNNCNMWRCNWSGLGPLQDIPSIIIPSDRRDLLMVDFLTANDLKQDTPVALPASIRAHIVNGGFCTSNSDDSYIWPHGPGGIFSINSGWEVVRTHRQRLPWAKWVWHPLLPPKIFVFLWKVLMNVLPIDGNVQKKGISLVSKCKCCELGHNLSSYAESVPSFPAQVPGAGDLEPCCQHAGSAVSSSFLHS